MRDARWWAVALTIPIVVAALLVCRGTSDRRAAPPRISGAYGALSAWGASRSYPEGSIPADGFSRAYEYATSTLQRPLDEIFDQHQASVAVREGVQWEPIGPTNGGGRTLTLAFDPTNPEILYAGAASGGLWRSTTGGVGSAAWERIETGFPELGVSTITFDPADPNTMYIGTGEVYNYAKSGDLESDRATRGSYGIGILKSTDGGASWLKSLDWSYNQQHGVWAVRVDPTNSSVVWAATTEGVYKSLDAGQTWSRKLAVAMAMDLVVHPTDSRIALAGCGNLSSAERGIYRTTDGGETWTRITAGGVPDDFEGKVQFGVTPADPDLVFASIGNGFTVNGPDNFTWLFRTTDFGASWELRGTTDYSRWQGWFAHDVAVHPTDPDTLVAVGIDVWKSTDGGQTLMKKSNYTSYFRGVLEPGAPEGGPNYSHADHHDVIFHPTDPGILYFANDGGVFRSLDGGETFEGANGGYQSQQFFNGFASDPTDPDLAIGGLQDFATAIYRGNGAWQRWVYSGDGGWAAIDANDPEVVYATSQELRVGKSLNGGDNFTYITPPLDGGPVAFIAPLVMAPSNSQVLYAASNLLFRTSDGGDSWVVGQGGAEIDGNPALVLAVAPRNEDVVYLATSPLESRGRVHLSTDGGSTLSDITGSLPDRYPGDLAVDPTDEATAYLTLSGFGSSHVFKSSDYGATWTDIDGGRLPDVPTTAVAVDPLFPENVYVGNDLGVFFTADEGVSWAQLHEGLPEAVLVADLSISESNRRVRAATHGQGVYELDLLGFSFTLSGQCPGSLSLRIQGAAPNGVVQFARASTEGAGEVPNGPCAGTPLGLADPRPVGSLATDAMGRIALDLEAPSGICGYLMQAVDPETCSVTNVTSVP